MCVCYSEREGAGDEGRITQDCLGNIMINHLYIKALNELQTNQKETLSLAQASSEHIKYEISNSGLGRLFCHVTELKRVR